MLKICIKLFFRRAAMHALNGRDRDRPAAGRLGKDDVRKILQLAWRHADALVPQAGFSQYRSAQAISWAAGPRGTAWRSGPASK